MKSKSKQSSNKTLPFINYPNFQVNARKQEDSSMDWSTDNPHTSLIPYIPPSEHVLSPCLKVVQVAATCLKQVVSIKVYSIMAMANHLMLAPGMEHFRQYFYLGLSKPY